MKGPPLDLVTDIHLGGLSLVTGLTDLVVAERNAEADRLVAEMHHGGQTSRPAHPLEGKTIRERQEELVRDPVVNELNRRAFASNLARDEARLMCGMSVIYIIAHAEVRCPQLRYHFLC